MNKYLILKVICAHHRAYIKYRQLHIQSSSSSFFFFRQLLLCYMRIHPKIKNRLKKKNKHIKANKTLQIVNELHAMATGRSSENICTFPFYPEGHKCLIQRKPYLFFHGKWHNYFTELFYEVFLLFIL